MSEVPLYMHALRGRTVGVVSSVENLFLCVNLRRFPKPRKSVPGGGWGNVQYGYLAHKKSTTPLGPPEDPRHRPTVGS